MSENKQSSLDIEWVVDAVSGSQPSDWSSTLASNRYRAILPAQALIAQGHQVRMTAAARWNPASGRPDVVVIGKMLPGKDVSQFERLASAVLEKIRHCQQRGVPVLADFNDDHFDHPGLGTFWRALSQSVDVCVAGSTPMATRLREVTQRPLCVVGDPVGSPLREPKVFRSAAGVSGWITSLVAKGAAPRLKLAWYGNPVNWPAMQAWAELIAPLAKQQRLLLWIVTAPQDRIQAFADSFNRRFGPEAMMELVPWDLNTQWDVVSDADVVLIPSDPQDAKKAVKTSNRLVDALHAGRHVVASPLPSYLQFESKVVLTDDPVQALQDYLKNPDAALENIREGQVLVARDFSSARIAEAWLTAFGEVRLADAPLAQAVTAVAQPSLAEAAPPFTSRAFPEKDIMPASPISLESIHRGKGSKVSDKWQSYFEVYERVFTPLRNRPISLLEIGVQNGGSLEVWAEYFPEAQVVVGCDINPLCAQLKFEDPRISVIVGDANQTDVMDQIAEVCDVFDVIIDDGSHVSDDILRSFYLYFPSVAPGGLYIIEDTHTMYRESFKGGILRRGTAHEFFKLFVDLINYEHWQGKLPIEKLFADFFPPEHMPLFIREGWVDGIEFRNSMVLIRKAVHPTHGKLGERVISGEEALVHQHALRLREGERGLAMSQEAGRPLVKLNLGCGDKLLPGYVNVDVVDVRAGKSPDVICDLRQLTPFSSDSVDEVLSVHVVEHFWRWEIESVLKEWIRVLKPGGKLIIECPNLQSACEEFLQDPDAHSAPGQEGQRTMWVFYGDPRWKDPLMVHRWGYTPASLGRLLSAVGLIDVRQEPAQFKLREPRDMRVVGVKPH